ncbi:MAG: hypothetical protein AB7F23_10325 [Phycisphaerae bacterium]
MAYNKAFAVIGYLMIMSSMMQVLACIFHVDRRIDHLLLTIPVIFAVSLFIFRAAPSSYLSSQHYNGGLLKRFLRNFQNMSLWCFYILATCPERSYWGYLRLVLITATSMALMVTIAELFFLYCGSQIKFIRKLKKVPKDKTPEILAGLDSYIRKCNERYWCVYLLVSGEMPASIPAPLRTMVSCWYYFSQKERREILSLVEMVSSEV